MQGGASACVRGTRPPKLRSLQHKPLSTASMILFTRHTPTTSVTRWLRRRRIAAAAEKQVSGNGAAANDPSRWLYEPHYGLPVVREKVEYADLLRDMRQGRVKEVRWWSGGDPYDVTDVPGPALIVYKDDTVKQAWIPQHDMRMAYAMESHGVSAALLPVVPLPHEFRATKPISANISQFVVRVFPILAVGLVYAAAQYAAFLKGDAEDRKKIRQADDLERKLRKEQELRDNALVALYKLAEEGRTFEYLKSRAQATKLNIDDAQLQEVVETVAAAKKLGVSVVQDVQSDIDRRRKAAEADKAGGSEEADSEDAQKMLQMKTVKIRNARLRAINRQKMKGKLMHVDDDVVTFDDVAGINDAKLELQEVVDFFTRPERFRASGARIPRGVLLCGPPGTGKTLLARAVAGESGAAFLSVNASEFVEMFVGVGAARVRDLFATARSMKPAIIFIDELDAVGRIRGGAQGNDERDQTLNQMLSELDGFDAETGVIVMAATNRRDILDPALIRPGRFDRQIFVGLPDLVGRMDVLQVHLRGRQHELSEEGLRKIAFQTRRYSGARLANLVNTAALIAGRDNRIVITTQDMQDALEFEQIGHRREPYDDSRAQRMALQEASTALIATLMPAIEPVVKATIVPSDKWQLGQTILDVNDQRELTGMWTRRYLEEQLLMVLASYAAEELKYPDEDRSSLHRRNLVMARRIVQKLVLASGMSDNPQVGPRTIATAKRKGGRELKQIITSRVTPLTLEIADVEMQQLLNTAKADVCAMLQRNMAALDALTNALLEKKELLGHEIRDIVEQHGHPTDLGTRKQDAAEFL